MRTLAAVAFLALVGIEYLALALSAFALAVAVCAWLLAREVKQSYESEIDRQSGVARDLEGKASTLDEKIRSHGSG